MHICVWIHFIHSLHYSMCFVRFVKAIQLHQGFYHILFLWDGLRLVSCFRVCFPMKTVTMLRRRSEFFIFLDNVCSVKSEKEDHQLSPCDDYLQVLLQMKMTSAVSEQKWFLQNCSSHFNEQLYLSSMFNKDWVPHMECLLYISSYLKELCTFPLCEMKNILETTSLDIYMLL